MSAPVKMRVGLTSAQWQLIHARSPRALMVAGKGSGKTFGIFWKMTRLLGENPGLRGLVVMPTNGMLEDVAVPTFDALLEMYGIPHYWKKPSGRNNLYVYVANTWTEVRFRSAEKPKRLEGAEYAWCIMDEAGQIGDTAFNAALSRLRLKGAAYHQAVVVGTPEGMSGPFYEHAEGDLYDGDKTIVLRARTYDNRNLEPSPQEYIETQLAFLPPHLRDQYVEGLFVPPTGRVYAHYDPATHERDLPLSTRADRHVMMCDFNIGRMVWPLGRLTEGGKRLEVVGEVVGIDRDTIDQSSEAAHAWAEILRATGTTLDPRQAAGHVQAYVDAAGGARSRTGLSDHQALKQAGFRQPKYKPGNPPIKDRVASLQRLLHERLPDGTPKFAIDPQKAPETAKAIKSQGYASNGDPDKSQGHDAVTDGVGYLCHYEWPATAPRGNMAPYSYR